MIKCVIFDIDNTLFDYDRNHLIGMKALADYCQKHFQLSEEAMLSYYEKAQKTMEKRIGTDTAAIHNRLLRFQCMLELLSQPLFPHAVRMYHAYWDTFVAHAEPEPGIITFLENLKKHNIKIGIGTDMTAHIQYRKLERLQLFPYIDFIVTSEEAGIEKPNPHFFSLCVEKSTFSVDECAFIGDNIKKDVLGSRACGLKGIWYSQGSKNASFSEYLEYPVIESFENINLEDLLKKLA